MTGPASLLARLGQYPEKARQALRQAAGAAADQAAQLAAAQAPVDSGRLRDSIAAAGDGDGTAVYAGCDYAAYVELGARAMPPRPFLAPGAQAADYAGLAARALSEAIK